MCPFGLFGDFLPDLLGLPREYFTIVDIAAFFGIMEFFLSRLGRYTGRLIAYAKENASAPKWITHPKPKNRAAQYMVRVIGRLGREFDFTAPSLYFVDVQHMARQTGSHVVCV